MDRLKTIFLSNMSHELNTPMSGIMGFSELLLQELQDKNHKDMAEFIHKSSKRLNDTLTSLLDISKLESRKINLDFSPIEIVSTLKNCRSRFTEAAIAKGLIINLKLEKEKIYIDAEPTIINKIFCNLLDNAVKYTKHGEIVLSVTKLNNKAIVKIVDSGIGISEENLELIFEPFRQASEGLTRKYEGSGLGLSITKKYVEILGGKIIVQSKIDMGTSITLEFPVSKK
jgi:signal transduction histidine kinase